MYFENVQQALEMGGHGVFVWSSYAVTFLVLQMLIIHPLLQAKRNKSDVAGKIKRIETVRENTGQTVEQTVKAQPENR